jgi:hypothetical protein
MSGRLVILRHKSWNVWNQDNITKVRNDEQKHREQEEAKKLKESELIDEKTLTVLKQSTSSQSDGEIQKFSLFDDPSCPVLSDRGKREIGNASYLAEAEAKKTKELKQAGVAPWGFSDVTTNK